LQLWCSAQEYVANANSGKFVPKIATASGILSGTIWNRFIILLLHRKISPAAAAMLDRAGRAP
jgi:hypothetical protein